VRGVNFALEGKGEKEKGTRQRVNERDLHERERSGWKEKLEYSASSLGSVSKRRGRSLVNG